MASRSRKSADEPVLALTGELTIYGATKNLALIRAHVSAHASYRFDLSEVSEIDSAGVQLLLVARRDAEEHGRSLRLLGCGAAVSEVLTLLGLGPSFGILPASAEVTS